MTDTLTDRPALRAVTHARAADAVREPELLSGAADAFILDRAFGSEPRHVPVPEGSSILEALEIGGVAPKRARRCVVQLDGVTVPQTEWESRRLKAGERLAVGIRPGRGKSSPLRILLQLVLFAVSVFFPAASPWAIGLVNVLGRILDAALVKPPQRKEDPAEKPSYAVEGASNELRLFGQVPVVLGERRVVLLHAARPYSEIVGDDVHYRMLLTAGLGPAQIGDILIGATPAGSYTTPPEIEIRTGAPGEPPVTLFTTSPREAAGGGTLVGNGSWVERETEPDTDEISLDWLFERGLVRFDSDGKRKEASVTLDIKWKRADEPDREDQSEWLSILPTAEQAETAARTVAGDSASRLQITTLEDYVAWRTAIATSGAADAEFTVTAADTKPVRRNKRWAVPPAQYRVATRRVTPDAGNDRISDEVQWSVLRSVQSTPPKVPEGATLIAIAIKATGQLQGTIEPISALVTSIRPTWDGTAFTGAAPTRNPGDLIVAALTGPGNSRPQPLSRLAIANLGAFAELCTARGWHADFVIEDGRSVADAVRQIAACGRGAMTRIDGQFGVWADVPRLTSGQLYTPRNSRGFKARKRFVPEVHALRIPFPNRDKEHRTDELTVYADGYTKDNATLIEVMPVDGVTGPDQIHEMGRYYLAQLKLRPESYSLTADIEHAASAVGDVAYLQHDAILVGIASARVVMRLVDEGGLVIGVRLDDEVPMQDGTLYGLRIRRSDITFDLPVVTEEGFTADVLFTDPVAADDAPRAGDLVSFGERGLETIEAVCTRKGRPAADKSVELEFEPYGHPGIDDATTGPIPPWDSKITRPFRPRPPTPTIKGVVWREDGIIVDFAVPPSRESEVAGFAVRWRETPPSGAERSWERLPDLRASDRRLVTPAPGLGLAYDIELTAFDPTGLSGPAVRTFEVEAEDAVPAPDLTSVTGVSKAGAGAAAVPVLQAVYAPNIEDNLLRLVVQVGPAGAAEEDFVSAGSLDPKAGQGEVAITAPPGGTVDVRLRHETRRGAFSDWVTETGVTLPGLVATDTTHVGGTAATDLLDQLAAAETAIADLTTIYGDTVSAAASAAAAATSAADALAASLTAIDAKDASEAAQAASEAAQGLAETAKGLAEAAASDAADAYAAAASEAAAALTQALAASGSATAAAGSASTASSQASAAAGSASAAAASVTAATTQASNASVSASNAATSATNASNSASAASTSAVSARSSAAATLPSNFIDSEQWLAERGVYTISGGKWTATANMAGVMSRGTMPVVAGKTYRIRHRVRVTSNAPTPADNRTWTGVYVRDTAGTVLSAWWLVGDIQQVVADGWVTHSTTFTGDLALTSWPTAATFQPTGVIAWKASNVASGATAEADLLELTDVTESTAAAGSASAAATSASSASTSATNAGTQASAASTSATNAATSAGAASTSAGAASTSASNAATSASTATTQANNAATSATAAANSATAAGGSATAASTSASTASTQATNAGNSATSAAASAVTATSTAAKTWPSTFEDDGKFWATNTGLYDAASLGSYTLGGFSWPAVSGVGKVFQTAGSTVGTLGHLAPIPLIALHSYKFTIKRRETVAATNTSGARQAYYGMWTFNADGALNGAAVYWLGSATISGVGGAWVEQTATVTTETIRGAHASFANAAFIRPIFHYQWAADAGVGYTSNGTEQTAFYEVRDVTAEVAAAGSAAAAASSASSASTSQTAAGTSATAAASSATSAATSAGAASTSAGAASSSASNAASSASTATTQANAASTSATNAANSATAAGGSASAAATSASTAATHATNAGNSSTSATAAAVTAKSVAAFMLPSGFQEDGTHWFNGYAGDPATRTSITAGGVYSFATVSGVGRVLRITGTSTDTSSVGVLNIAAGRTYRATVTGRVNGTKTGAVGLTVYALGLNSSYNYVYVAGDMATVVVTASETWFTVTATVSGTTALANGAAFMRILLRTDSASSNVIEWSQGKLEDVTESVGAAASASAAATSASAASTSAGTAGTQASAASTSATNAATSASSAGTSATNASASATSASGSATSAATSATTAAGSATTAGTQAGIATTQATNASNSAAAAASSAVLAASVGSQALNPNPVWANWTNPAAEPGSWSRWAGGGTVTRVTGRANTSPYAAQIAVGANQSDGFSTPVTLETNSWYVLEYDATLTAGDLDHVYAYLQGAYWELETTPDISGSAPGTGTVGRLYQWRILYKWPGASGTGYLYGLTGWSGLTPTWGAKTITWERIAVRPASAGEVETGIARNGSATLSAEIAARAATAASATAAVATSVTTLTARVDANPNIFDNSSFSKGLVGVAYNSIGMEGPTTVYPDIARSVLVKGYAASATVADYAQFSIDVPIDTSGDGTGTGRTGTFTFSCGFYNYGMTTGDIVLYIQGINSGSGTEVGYSGNLKHIYSPDVATKRVSATVVLTTASKMIRIGFHYLTGNAYGGSGGGLFTWDWKLERGAIATSMSVEAQIASTQSVAVDTADKMTALYSVDVSTSASKAGFVIASGAVSYFDVYADRFRIWDGAQRVLAFQVVNGQTQIRDALIRSLSVYPNATATIAHPVQLRPLLYTGAAGATITFPGTYDTGIPYVRYAGGITPAVTAGQSVDISAYDVSPTGFKIRAKKFTPGTITNQTSSAGSNVGGTPEWRCSKPSTQDADSNAYVYTFSGTAALQSSEPIGGGNVRGEYAAQILIYCRPNGGSWTYVRTETVAFTYTASGSVPSTRSFSGFVSPSTLPAIGANDGSNHFGIHPGTGATITAFAGVTYTTTATSSESDLSGSFTFEVWAPT
jgi:sulfur carrier protein ThiS